MTKPYGCHNKPRVGEYLVNDGFVDAVTVDGRIKIQLVKAHKDTLSLECQYRKAIPDDPRCVGCMSP